MLVHALALTVMTVGPSATWRVSVPTGGQGPVSGPSGGATLSANARFVSFNCNAPDLVDHDTNSTYDVFVHDRRECTTTRVSVSSFGEEGNAGSTTSSLSADGRYVAFTTYSSNLTPVDWNFTSDVFMHDRETGVTTLISARLPGSGGVGDTGNGSSAVPTVSATGHSIAFQSAASNLILDDTNGDVDIFVRDCVAGVTTRVSVSTGGIQADHDCRRPVMTPDARFVAFDSLAGNLAPNATLGQWDIFVHDRDTDEDGVLDEPGAIATVLGSVSSHGEAANDDAFWPHLSADGRWLTFQTSATNLADDGAEGSVYLRDLKNGITVRIPGSGGNNTISQDGRYVAYAAGGPRFESLQVLRFDRLTGETRLISVNTEGVHADAIAQQPFMSPDGSVVAFVSTAGNLDENDANSVADIFVHAVNAADVNADGTVDVGDVLEIILHWSDSCGSADVNTDGTVDYADLLIVIAGWSG